MIDFVKLLYVTTKEKLNGYVKCKRCGLCWSLTSFYNLRREWQKKLRENKGCPLCYNENWKNGKYTGGEK